MGRQKRIVLIDQLDDTIEELLKAAPRHVNEVTRAVGWSIRTVRPRLEQLELDHRAHRVRIELATSPTVCYQWHHGPSPDAAPAAKCRLSVELPNPKLRAIIPFQYSVQNYPAIDSRDPLVAALFGPARAHQVTSP